MNKFLSSLLFFSFYLSVNAQNYNGPESVEYDETRNCYYVANTTSHQIIKVDNSGTQTVLFTFTGVNGPYGIERIGDTLYCCSGSFIRGIDLTNNTNVLNVNIGATFLNGITHSPQRILYLTDFTAKVIYRFNTLTQQFNIMVNSVAMVNTPNGIIYDSYDMVNPRLVVACWGTNAKIKAVNLSDSVVTNLATTTLGNIDGICKGVNGKFYTASWTGGKLTEWDSTFTTNSLIAGGLNSPADICYNFTNDTVAVPNSGNNTVTYHYVGSVTSSKFIETNTINCFPNPFTNHLSLWLNKPALAGEWSIFNSTGQKIEDLKVNFSNNVELDVNLPAGIYFFKNNFSGKSIKLICQP